MMCNQGLRETYLGEDGQLEGGVLHPFWGLMGSPGVAAGELGLLGR